jgi:hypothetical protein
MHKKHPTGYHVRVEIEKIIRKSAIFQKKLYFFGYFLSQTLDRVI